MKKLTKVSLISGLAVAAVAAVTAIGMGVGGVARPSDVGQHRPPGTEMVSGVSSPAPTTDASSLKLLTNRVSARSGSVEYAAAWRLDSSDGDTLSISITGPEAGARR